MKITSLLLISLDQVFYLFDECYIFIAIGRGKEIIAIKVANIYFDMFTLILMWIQSYFSNRW